MAEGLEDFELKEHDDIRDNYDLMSYEELKEELARYETEDFGTMSDKSKKEFEYIKESLDSARYIEETSFIEPDTVHLPSMDFTGTIGFADLFGGETVQLNDFFNFTPKETDGPNSKELLNKLKRKFANGRELGWQFNGKDVLVTRGGGGRLIYSQNKKPEYVKNNENLKTKSMQILLLVKLKVK